ncbi:MAG TPA: Hsp20/alpha crystallin family protein [Alphaproteobacteria bacterium]|jgi:HSP20 family protein|nr:Hsp20/alpha crystallin family protein [Alphaproteobacteria bacterium]
MPKSEPEVLSAQRATVPARSSWSLNDLQRQVDRLFDDFGRTFFDPPFRRSEAVVPMMSTRANVAETENAYEIEMELPGLGEKDIDVKLSGDILTVSGERKEETDEEKKEYHLVERMYGSFSRSFTLPDNVAQDKIAASFKHGVLKIGLPKKQMSKPGEGEKKIDIKAE